MPRVRLLDTTEWLLPAIFVIGLCLALPACQRRPLTGDPQNNSHEARVLVNHLVTQIRSAEQDSVRASLATEPSPLPREITRSYLRSLDEEAAAIRTTAPKAASPGEVFSALNRQFFGPGGFVASSELSGPEGVSIAAVLDSRRGTCVGLAIVYLALVQRLGLDAHAVATPVHVFIRVHPGNTAHNVELTESGREIEDDTYRRRHKIDEASIAAGVFMREISNAEVVAHLLSNQAVTLGKQGRLDEALARYDAALTLAPQLVAAWYNRGIDLMNAGRLQEALASFTRAIELYASDAQAHNNRGLTKLKLGDRQGAEADFRRALEIDPGLREAQENLKRLLSTEGTTLEPGMSRHSP